MQYLNSTQITQVKSKRVGLISSLIPGFLEKLALLISSRLNENRTQQTTIELSSDFLEACDFLITRIGVICSDEN